MNKNHNYEYCIDSDNDHQFRTEYTDIVIVGAGVAGTSTLHHLLPYTNNKEIIVIDAGTAPGHGFDHHATNTSAGYQDKESCDAVFQPRYSGTAVFMDGTDIRNPSTNTTCGKDESLPHTDVKCRPSSSSSLLRDANTAATATSSLQVSSQQERSIIKMMVQIFAGSIDTFISHHGVNGAQIYLQCTRQGLQLQKRLVKELLRNTKHLTHPFSGTGNILHELGSLYLAYEDDVAALKKEYHQFVSLGTDLFDHNGIEWYEVMDEDENGSRRNILYNSDRSCSIRMSQSNPFRGAIYFPNDAIIDSSQYSKLLLHDALHRNDETNDQVDSRMNTIVTHIERLDQLLPYPWGDTSTTEKSNSTDTNEKNSKDPKIYGAIVTCYDSATQQTYRIYCRHVIVAIGGLSVPQGCCAEDLYGIIRPCYSYLAHVPMKHPMKCQFVNDIVSTTNDENDDTNNRSNSQRSPNFFTWNFTHDWCYTDPHHIRVSGEDHYSARKDAQQSKRCQNLIRWTYEQYNSASANDDVHNDDSAARNGESSMENDASMTIPQQSGVYTETPDCAPVIGSIASDTDNTICYIVGCNAWGQAILSYAATLVPPILGYRPMTDMERDAMKVLSIQRFPHSIVTPKQTSQPNNSCVK